MKEDEMHIVCMSVARARMEGFYLLRRHPSKDMLGPIRGILTASPSGLLALRSQGARFDKDRPYNLSLQVPGEQVAAVEGWFKGGEGRERSCLRIVRPMLRAAVGNGYDQDLRTINEKSVRFLRVAVASDSLTLVEVFRLAAPPARLVHALHEAATRPDAHLRLVSADEIQAGKTESDHMPISELAQRLFAHPG